MATCRVRGASASARYGAANPLIYASTTVALDSIAKVLDVVEGRKEIMEVVRAVESLTPTLPQKR